MRRRPRMDVFALPAGGLPNLYIPRRDHFLKVDAIPVLGTGKLDLRAAKRLAVEQLVPPARMEGSD